MSSSTMEQKMQTVLVRQKMSTLDEEGKLRKFDIREDPEQKAKCDQTMELLLAAGYFRVRIRGLSEFDKVVGGLAWSIQSCNFTVDIDVLYQENATLGQKITLTERIILVLSRMKCPHALEPHQIQGGDFIHIYPVVQWLVKRVFERRADIGDFNRAYTLNQYEKIFEQETLDSQSKIFKQNIEAIRKQFRPQRRYRCLDKKSSQRRQRIHLTLLEFGQNISSTDENDKSPQDLDFLTKSLINEKSKIPSQIVHSLVNQQQDTIRGIIENFEEKSRLTEAGQQQLAIRTYKIQINQQNQRMNLLQKQIEDLKTKKDEKRNQALEIKQQYEQLNRDIEEINQQRENIDPKFLERVESLVTEYENIKKQETDKRSKYKAEKIQLEEEIKEIEQRLQSNQIENNDEEKEKLKQIEEQYELVLNRLQKQKLLLAKKVREISTLHRRIDDIPTPIELSQYRQTFFQLYNQSAVLYRQTKQNYTLYNTFTDLISYMKKEIDLIESIYQNYPQAILSANGKETFLKQLEGIVESVRQNRSKIERHQQEEKCKRDSLNIQLSELIDKARQYAKVMKDFQEAIKENESLTNK